MKMPKKLVIVGLELQLNVDGFPFFKVVAERKRRARAVYTLSQEMKPSGKREKKWTLRAHDNAIDEIRKYNSVMQLLVENKVKDEAFTGEIH